MDCLGIYVFNADRNQFLQFDEKTWGPFSGAAEFTPGNEDVAEAVRERVSGDDVTYTFAALH